MDLRLPKLGEGAESGTVVSVLVKEGDSVTKGQTLIELENEKAVAPIPATVAGTVAKLRVGEVGVHSRRAANTVHQQMVSGLAGRYREVIDLGVKKGPFYVLFLSNMPAILVEAGFLTNFDEARRLRDESYLDELAGQITLGLTRYRDANSEFAMGRAE